MNRAFFIILVLSILAIIAASVYLINRKSPPQPFSNQLGLKSILQSQAVWCLLQCRFQERIVH